MLKRYNKKFCLCTFFQWVAVFASVFVIFFSGIFLFNSQKIFADSAGQLGANVSVPSIKIKNRMINFYNTDDNSSENLIIKSNKKIYSGLFKSTIYFSVTNVGNKSENVRMQFYFPQNDGNVENIKEIKKDGNGLFRQDRLNLSNTKIDSRGFFKRLLGIKSNIRKKHIPVRFEFRRSTSNNISIVPGKTKYFSANISFKPQTSGEFYIEAIGDSNGYGLLDPWWNSSFLYKEPITVDNVNNSSSLSDFQVFVNIDSSNTSFWSHVKSDGGDVRFANSSETAELSYYNLYWNYSSSTARYLVKVDNIPASSTSTMYIYYGNSAATSNSSAENALSYSTKVDRFYAIGSINRANSALSATFFDNNDFGVGTYSDTNWNTGTASNPKSVSASYITGGTSANSTKPFVISASNVNSGEMWAPAAWESKLFVTTFPRGGTNFAFYNPNSSTTTITVYKDGALQETISLSGGGYVEKNYTHTNNAHWRVSSTLKIVAYQWATATEDHAEIPPPSKIYDGIVRNTRVIGSEDNTNITIYYSDGTTETNTINSSTVWTISKSGGTYGSGPSFHLIADKPVYVLSYADGNGTELQAGYPNEDLDKTYLIANDYVYLSCSAPYDNTTITVYDLSGTQLATSGNLGSNGVDYPHQWKDGTSRSGGVKVSANNPIYCYYDEATQDDERNIANIVLNRKGTWPRPYVSSFGAEQQYTGAILIQNYYKWYVNTDAITPSDPWPAGATDLGENTPIPSSYSVSSGDILRLRMSIQASSTDMLAGSDQFKLQFGATADGLCSSVSSWGDVGGTASTTIWRGYDNASIADGATIASTLLSVSDVGESYEETNISASNPNAISVGQDGEWDWVIQDNNATDNTYYCFRMVGSGGMIFNQYNNIPKLITNTPPGVPTQTNPFDYKKVNTATPSFEFYALDSSNDDLVYQVEWDTDNSFSSPVSRSSDIDAGFLNASTTLDTSPFNSGDTIKFTVQSSDALLNNTTYWWRVRAKDVNGSNTWGNWSTNRSLTIDTSTTNVAWYQSTDEQFSFDSLSNAIVITTGDGGVRVNTQIGEYGKIVLTNNSTSTVSLGEDYGNGDLATVASARYAPTADLARVPRITKKTSNSFDVKVDNYNASLNATTTVDWVAMEPGSWTIDNGASGEKVIAGSQNTNIVACNGTWPTGTYIAFSPAFSASPAVIHTVASYNDSNWVFSSVNNGTEAGEPTASGMYLLMDRSWDTCSHNPEDVDYVAFDVGHGTNSGSAYDATRSTDSVACCNTTGYSVDFSSPYSSPPSVLLTSQLGEDGGNGGYSVIHTGSAVSTTTAYCSIDEDGPGADRTHTTEIVSLLSFAQSSGSIIKYNSNTGTIISPAINFSDGSANNWDNVFWNDDETNGSMTYQVQYYNGSSWGLIPDTDLSGNSSGFATSPIDISSLNTTTYNKIRIVGNFTYSSGSPYLYNWGVLWGSSNSAPVVSSVDLNGGNSIILTENSTTTVQCTATLTDANGYIDIQSATSTIYRSGVGSDCVADDNNCYKISSCSLSGGSGNDVTATCSADIWFNADPTDSGAYSAETWQCGITAIDSQGASGTSIDSTPPELNTLLALNIGSDVNYGTLIPGNDTGVLNSSTTIINTGNASIDVNLSGTNMISGTDTIAVNNQKYATSSVSFSSGTQLTNIATHLELPTNSKPTTHPSNVSDSVYWGIQVPLGTPVGVYSGTITFNAVAD